MTNTETRDAIERRIAAGEVEGALGDLDAVLRESPAAADWAQASWAARKKALCYFMTNRIHDANAVALESRDYARRSGEAFEEAEAENMLGILRGEIGELETAVQHLQRSYELHRSAESPRMATVLNNIGNTYLIMEDAERALAYFRRAVEEARDYPDQSTDLRRVEGTALGNVGRALTALGRPDEAVPVLQESIALFDSLGMETLRVHGLVKLAAALEAAGDDEEAEDLYREALTSAEERNDESWVYELHGSMATLLMKLGRRDEAEPHLRRAINDAPDAASVFEVPYWRRQYSELIEERGDTGGALEEMRRAFRDLEEVAKQRSEKQLYQAMGRLELQRTEHEKELYRLKNEELAAALSEVEALRDELEQRNAELAELVVRDPLTALYNRRWFVSRLETELERSRRYGHTLSVVLLDIDHFKVVNDTYGHAAGDRVLVVVSELLTRHTRSSDEVARYGGEEFALIMPETALPEAATVCEKLRSVIESTDWRAHEVEAAVTASIGVAEVTADDSSNALIDRADRRLYLAKQRGRNRVVDSD
ncbi:MAG: diguanylate cyclase [bacterium]